MENVTHIQTSITLHTPDGDIPTLLDMTHAEEADTLQLHLRYECSCTVRKQATENKR